MDIYINHIFFRVAQDSNRYFEEAGAIFHISYVRVAKCINVRFDVSPCTQ